MKLRIATTLALSMLAATALPVFAAAPHITLPDGMMGFYERIRVFVAVALVVVGLVAVVTKIWNSLTGHVSMGGGGGGGGGGYNGGGGGGFRAGEILQSVGAVVVLVVVGIFLLYNWLGLVNGALELAWSVGDGDFTDAAPAGTPHPAADPTPADATPAEPAASLLPNP